MNRSLYQKLFDSHVVHTFESGTCLLYIDRHLIHEVTSPQAFDGLRRHNRIVRQPTKTFATMDHNVSTLVKDIQAAGKLSEIQLRQLIKNCEEFNINLFDIHHPYQGIVHVIGPEQGMTLPGMTIVCGDSHTSTHGAFGALAFGIGTSEVEHVLATQTLQQTRSKIMKIEIIGEMLPWITAKDVILAIIGKVGVYNGSGYVIEFCGETVNSLSMEGRMTLCNMAIEMGARSALIAPDDVTYNYLYDRQFSPKGKVWEDAILYWKTLTTDPNTVFDKTFVFNASEISPQVTWGTNLNHVISIDQSIPSLENFKDIVERNSAIKALSYMGLFPNSSLVDVSINKVFIGSCTNSRIEDLRSAASVIQGRHVADGVNAIVVPGSNPVKEQAEIEGLDKIFIDAGFEWRFPGCSMCLAMNNDRLNYKERCASTSNRNFEGRQGYGGRTHLLSPAMASAAAIFGRFIDVREIM